MAGGGLYGRSGDWAWPVGLPGKEVCWGRALLQLPRGQGGHRGLCTAAG